MRLVSSSFFIRYFIIGLFFIVSPIFSLAHNPLSSRYHLEAGEQASLLSINLSQDGVNSVMLKKYGKEKLEGSNQKEFEELIVDYIKSNFNLIINGKKISLKKGGIKSGSHQTDLKFVLPPILKETKKIDINIPAFKENENHQTIFSYNINGKSDHKILSLQNDYQSTLIFGAAVSETSNSSNSWLWFILVGLISVISIILLKVNFGSKN